MEHILDARAYFATFEDMCTFRAFIKVFRELRMSHIYF